MNEMVERVAQAICGNDNPANILEIHRHRARAAVVAMREPTEAMEAAGDNLDDWGVPSDPGGGNTSALAHWHAMIDAAIKDGAE